MTSDRSPSLFGRLRSYLTADTDEPEVYDGDRCPNCRARLAMTQVTDKKERTVTKNKFCRFCGWQPGKEPDRTPAEARQVAKARAEQTEQIYRGMVENDR